MMSGVENNAVCEAKVWICCMREKSAGVVVVDVEAGCSTAEDILWIGSARLSE